MKKALSLLMVAMLSLGSLLAQNLPSRNVSSRININRASTSVAAPSLAASAAKDITCAWAGNVTASDSPSFGLGGLYSLYGISTYAEHFSNNATLSIDSISFLPGDEGSAGNITLALYDDNYGEPGTMLSQVILSNWVADTINEVALPTPVTVTGDYYIVFTVADDDAFIYTTDIRSPSTAMINYFNMWFDAADLLSVDDNTTLTVSLYLFAHACQYTASSDSLYTITALANDATMGSVTGGGAYYGNASATLTATPFDGYRFLRWHDGNTSNPRTVSVMGDATYTAIFAEQLHCTQTLPYFCGFEDETDLECWNLIDADGDGHNWYAQEYNAHTGNYCLTSASYANNMALAPNNWLISPDIIIPEGGATLSWWVAAQDANYPEEHYKVMLSTNAGLDTIDFAQTLFSETLADGTWAQHSVSINAADTVRIAFVHCNCVDMFRLNIDDILLTANDSSAAENVVITALANDNAMGTVSGGGVYAIGETVTLTATPNPGYAFAYWSDNNTDNPRTLIATANTTLTAHFVADAPLHDIYVLGALIDPAWGDTVFYINEEAEIIGNGSYPAGTEVTLSVVPHEPSAAFIGWHDGNQQMPRHITVSTTATYTAYFEIKASILNADGLNVALYPNPTTDLVTVEADGIQTIELLDLAGRRLLTTHATTLSLAPYANGTYLLVVTTPQGRAVRKVVKQ